MTKLYGLIGYPLGHSFSARYFNGKFSADGTDAEYRLFPIETIDRLPELIDTNENLRGLNVTIPYKEKVIPFLDDISEEAGEIGAVNTIRIIRNEEGVRLEGYNTDSPGFTQSIKGFIPQSVKNALILGSGGASKAISYALHRLGISTLCVSRSPKKGDITYADIDEQTLRDNPLIVNTTPLGMYPETDAKPDIPYRYLTSANYCFDAIYNPRETIFLQLAAQYGAHTKSGMEMLINQAEASWKIWQ